MIEVEGRFWRSTFSLLALALALYVLVKATAVVVPFFLGLTLAYLVHPLVYRFAAMGLRRDRVVIVLYVAMLAVIVAAAALLVPKLVHELSEVLRTLPEQTETLNRILTQLSADAQSMLRRVIGARADSIVIVPKVDHLIEMAMSKVPNNIMSVAEIGLWALLIPFVAFFGLTQGRRWIDDLFQLTPARHVEGLLAVFEEVHVTLGGYIRGQILDALCVGFVTTVGLWLLGVNGALTLGCITGMLNVVPFMAPIVGGSLALLAAMFQGQASSVLIGIVGLYIFVRLLDDFVFMPFVVGSSVHLHPMAMLFAILAGYEVAGLFGLVFSVPIAAVVKVLLSILVRARTQRLQFQGHIVT